MLFVRKRKLAELPDVGDSYTFLHNGKVHQGTVVMAFEEYGDVCMYVDVDHSFYYLVDGDVEQVIAKEKGVK